ncbi:hypothetical protein [Novipirellula sp.]|uniref:hypothetical protein n=1 Tax=Novipirellula sp. TaxID=2795430 RepID=UPI00356B28DC
MRSFLVLLALTITGCSAGTPTPDSFSVFAESELSRYQNLALDGVVFSLVDTDLRENDSLSYPFVGIVKFKVIDNTKWFTRHVPGYETPAVVTFSVPIEYRYRSDNKSWEFVKSNYREVAFDLPEVTDEGKKFDVLEKILSDPLTGTITDPSKMPFLVRTISTWTLDEYKKEFKID